MESKLVSSVVRADYIKLTLVCKEVKMELTYDKSVKLVKAQFYLSRKSVLVLKVYTNTKNKMYTLVTEGEKKVISESSFFEILLNKGIKREEFVELWRMFGKLIFG